MNQRTLANLNMNLTDTELTEENIQPTELALEFGFDTIQAKCLHCGAELVWNSRNNVLCLNACHMRYGYFPKLKEIIEQL